MLRIPAHNPRPGCWSESATLAPDAGALDTLLAACASVSQSRGAQHQETGVGSNVLDRPLRALHHLTQTLRACPGAPGERWYARFSLPGFALTADFTDGETLGWLAPDQGRPGA